MNHGEKGEQKKRKKNKKKKKCLKKKKKESRYSGGFSQSPETGRSEKGNARTRGASTGFREEVAC